MRTRRAHPSILKASSGAGKLLGTGTLLASFVCAGALVALASACSGGESGAGGSGAGTGGAGAAGGGQGGDGLQDFVTSASSSSSSSSSGTGGQNPGPMCDPPNPNGGVTAFAAAYGDAQTQSGVSVSTDKTGNILLAGALQGTMNLGGTMLTSGGKEDAFVAKLNSAGQVIWAKRFGDGQNQSATGIGADAEGNVYVTGIFIGTVNFGGSNLTSDTNFFQDVFLVKFAPDGSHVWSKKFGDSNIQYARALAVDGVGNVVIAGYFQQQVDFGGGVLTAAGQAFDAFVAKFNATGQHLWSKKYGNDADQSAKSLAVDGAGNVYVAGEASGAIDFGAGLVMAQGNPSAFVAKLDSQGAPLWAKLSSGAGKASANAVAVSPSGAVAVAGQFQGTFDLGGKPMTNIDVDDAFVSVLTSSGAQTYTRAFGDPTFQRADGVAFAPNGDVLLAGAFTGSIDLGGGASPSADGFDMFLGRLAAKDGCLVWGRSYGGPLVQSPQSLVFDPVSGNVILTGSFGGTVDFGLGPLTAAGDDAFLFAVKP
ncbi:SBBP repeat-containing protein [Polyangium sorediatum]|uniref:SBBP repeat-containing protein n=1 Tax=Polyangium sorediatum TaxID=889274 RepID=A0ABT6P396_9BACT|nr:SBBP repeat-containing protein [Polyangium sorediatum]MDI1435074.1 SBBP repeat-containing protein [Polyangium sorediatum]